MRILVLADRDWTHPEAGGSGQNLHRQVEEFLAHGHSVTVLAAGYRGGQAHEHHSGAELIRVGGRTTVFPRGAWKAARELAADADVVLEVINGITFLTPLWLHRPHVALVHHVHAGSQYLEEMGWLGRPAGAVLETLPLRWLYHGRRFVCVSESTQNGLIGCGIPRRQIAVSYNGVDRSMFGSGRRAERPTFLVLGRLKRYKRIELVLEAIADIPDAHLEIAGDGSHREGVLAAVERLDLTSRVTVRGHVDEATKRQLLHSAWAHVTASAAEGWGLTVLEAAACGTPSIGVATRGLREAIEHGQTGLLARDVDELREHVRRLTHDRDLVERLGNGARERVRSMTWKRTAEVTLAALQTEVTRATSPPPATRRAPRFGDAIRAAGLASAVLANSAVALLCTVVFARWLGIDRYGSLAALLSGLLILMVPGSALQAAVARDISRDPGGPAEALARRGLSLILPAAIPLAAILALVRVPLASLLGENLPWASAAVVWFAWLWVGLSLQRGLLQGQRRYGAIGVSLVVEALGRLAFGAALLALGLGATGALLGTGFAIASAWILVARLDRPPGWASSRPSDLWRLLRTGGAPLGALSLVAVLQNADVILVRHRMSGTAAGVYAGAAVAARGVLWFGVGLGLFLLPEAARRARAGGDPRAVLAQMIGLVCVLAIPLTAIYAAFGQQLLRVLFHVHHHLPAAAGALPLLSLAMALLAISYLVIQYLLALRRRSFAIPLVLAVALESTGVLLAGASFAGVTLAIVVVQALLLGALLTTALSESVPALAAEEVVVA